MKWRFPIFYYQVKWMKRSPIPRKVIWWTCISWTGAIYPQSLISHQNCHLNHLQFRVRVCAPHKMLPTIDFTHFNLLNEKFCHTNCIEQSPVTCHRVVNNKKNWVVLLFWSALKDTAKSVYFERMSTLIKITYKSQTPHEEWHLWRIGKCNKQQKGGLLGA